VKSARVAVITGGGSGLGRATAEVLAAKGYSCVVTGRREEPVVRTSQSLAANGAIAEPVVADVTNEEDRAKLVDRALELFGRLDVLVNNAGISHQAPLLAVRSENWRQVMATNLEAMFFLSQAALPPMREQHFGRIVNIASVYGSLAMNGQLYASKLEVDTPLGPTRQVAYHASKGGVLNLTRDLAVAVAPWGITVNCVSPGMFLTEQSDAVSDPKVVEQLTKMTPLGRLGDPAEVGHAVAFLASDEAGFITGIDLRVDGGWALW
jgi:NAD(P)-dependent dehydrogenase (short-subunit alcohol dehydrogenase family)